MTYNCADCGKDWNVFPYYMVQNYLWDEYGVGEGMLCLHCLTSRMGRKLTPKDFTAAPVNHNLWYIETKGSRIREAVTCIVGYPKQPPPVQGFLYSEDFYDVYKQYMESAMTRAQWATFLISGSAPALPEGMSWAEDRPFTVYLDEHTELSYDPDSGIVDVTGPTIYSIELTDLLRETAKTVTGMEL